MCTEAPAFAFDHLFTIPHSGQPSKVETSLQLRTILCTPFSDDPLKITTQETMDYNGRSNKALGISVEFNRLIGTWLAPCQAVTRSSFTMISKKGWLQSTGF